MLDLIRVLIVDDHPAVRRALAISLTDLGGIEIVGEAQDGEEAIELTSQLSPDVVLMDISMPRVNCVEATRRVVSSHGTIRVIGLSIGDDALGDEICDAGAVTFVSKTCDPAVIVEAIRFAAESPMKKPR